ncbi:type II secretion system protein N [Maricaulis sp.]|uniref:type II secretion system protein N n=1 Tax=Maricaulis sp. TaxID=1486257 RepID=UPI0026235C1E|nr:type II secretion system protein N [Maricaulis sp.]
MVGRILLVLVLLATWLVVLLPLKAVAILAGGADRLGYSDVFGTVWNGRVYGLEVNGDPVREVAVSLRPLALLTGRIAADWRIADEAVSGSGRAALAGRMLALDNVSLALPLSRLGGADVPGLDPQEAVFVRLPRLRLDGDACVEAAGTVRTGALVTLAAAYGFEGPVITGELSCRGGDLVLEFGGEEAGLSLSGEAVLRRSGYDWQVGAHTDRAELADIFALAGLERDGDVWRAEGSSRYALRN